MEVEYTFKKGLEHLAFVVILTYILLFIILGTNILNESSDGERVEHEVQNEELSPDSDNIAVPLINQFPELPTGCEVTSAAMLMNYYGIDVNKEVLADEISKAPLPDLKNGYVHGYNPNEYFIGNPRDNKSFGVFHKPIHKLISTYISAEDITGCDFSEIVHRVKNGQPVMAWITRDLAAMEHKVSWYIGEELFWWPKGEHTVIITGIEGNNILVNDPYNGQSKSYDLSNFQNAWEEMGRQAIYISKYPNSE